MADDSHRISLQEAVEMVARARRDPSLEVKGWRFGGAILREILDHPGVTGVRAYVARDAKEQPTLVLVGTDPEGKDVSAATLAEFAWPCPPYCDENSPFFAP